MPTFPLAHLLQRRYPNGGTGDAQNCKASHSTLSLQLSASVTRTARHKRQRDCWPRNATDAFSPVWLRDTGESTDRTAPGSVLLPWLTRGKV